MESPFNKFVPSCPELSFIHSWGIISSEQKHTSRLSESIWVPLMHIFFHFTSNHSKDKNSHSSDYYEPSINIAFCILIESVVIYFGKGCFTIKRPPNLKLCQFSDFNLLISHDNFSLASKWEGVPILLSLLPMLKPHERLGLFIFEVLDRYC